MEVSYHAAQRFLQRVIKKDSFTDNEVQKTRSYLNRVVKDIVVNTYTEHFALPGFEKSYKVICKENMIITIIPKHD